MRCGHPHTPDLIVKVDGAVQSFCQREGEAVYPIVFEEMTYLPVRSIGGPCGKEVTWIAYSGGGEDFTSYAPGPTPSAGR